MSFPFYKDSARVADGLASRQTLPQAHLGLWFTRFYDGFTAPAWDIDTDSKRGFIDRTVQLSTQQDGAGRVRIKALAERQQKLCEALGGRCCTLTAEGPLVTGTGLSHPVENGFTFHPTTGMPYLPASGVKGLLRAWVEVWADLPDAERRDRVALWFGAVEGQDEQDAHSAGALIFFDALPTAPVALRCDILTPHMGKWYERGDELTAHNYASTAPGDWHSPVPSSFLVADRGAAFVFGIAPRCTGDAGHDARARAAVPQALQALQQALEWIGAGAKTAGGYGRMIDKAARDAQQLQQALAESGLASGEEAWPDAAVTWNKGKVELKVGHQGRSCSLTQQAARDMRSQLAPADLKKLDNGKTVKARAVVEVKGNLIRLVSLASLPPG